MQRTDGIPVWGTPVDQGALAQIKRCSKTADKVAMMADHHKGYAVPIGGVAAYRDSVSPSGVGFDIGCGNKAVLTDASLADVQNGISSIMNEVVRVISLGVGRRNNESVDHALFDSDEWRIRALAPLKEMARQQLGTVGSGNHYVDIFHDELSRVWIGVYFGSRGLGHKTATFFLKEAGATDGRDVNPACFRPAHRSVRITSNVCVSPARTRTPAVTGCATALPRFSGRTRSKRFTITTTSPGVKSTAGKSFGSSAKARRRRFPASVDSLAAPWATGR